MIKHTVRTIAMINRLPTGEMIGCSKMLFFMLTS
jgi:hypothetical protein